MSEASLGLLLALASITVAAAPPCALTGSPSLLAESRAMLRLGDVQGCEGVRYEVIPGVMLEGQPAVRLLPDVAADCAAVGAASVSIGGHPAQRVGDLDCPPGPTGGQ